MSPDQGDRGITGGISDGADTTRTAHGKEHKADQQGMNGPPSPSRVDLVVASWAAMAAFEASTGCDTGDEMHRALAARGVPVEVVEDAHALLALERAVEVEGLSGRVEDLDAEVEAALRALHASEVAAFGEAAVTFAHATHPDAATVLEAVDAMTPTDWLLFDRMSSPHDAEETTP